MDDAQHGGSTPPGQSHPSEKKDKKGQLFLTDYYMILKSTTWQKTETETNLVIVIHDMLLNLRRVHPRHKVFHVPEKQ